MMAETKRLLCEGCWEEVDAKYEMRHHVEDVRGVTVEADIEHLICPKCGTSIGWAPLVDRGFDRLYRAYREKMGIMQPEEIVALRKKYGFSQRVLAAILGIGVASLQRYEHGYLATDSHAQLLRSARDPRFLKKQLLSNLKGLSEAECEKALAKVESVGFESIDYAIVRLDLLDGLPRAASAETGMRAFDADRLREVVAYLAAHVSDLYRTKLNKVLFYLDFASYRDRGEGFTGLRYAKAEYGPVPDQYELIMAALVDDEALSLHEQGEGQVVVARRGADLSAFSPSEVTLLDAVCAFANTFASTSALSEFSHGEPGWKDTELGGFIGYGYASRLQWEG